MWIVKTLIVLWSDYVYSQHLGIPQVSEYQHYCDLSCFVGESQVPNIACDLAPCLPAYSCGEHHKRLPFNDAEREYIVQRHNEIRSEVSATDMMAVSYDKELEFLASCWANQCMESPRPSHARDQCRATVRYSDNGQNTWANASLDNTIDWSDLDHIEDAITAWYLEQFNINSDIINSYRYNKSEDYEYYAQMVWSETNLVGCGRTQFSDREYVGLNVICNYGPGGIIPGNPVYAAGQPPCSKYENMTINEQFPTLCGDIRPISADDYQPKFELDAVNVRSNVRLLLIIILFNIIVK